MGIAILTLDHLMARLGGAVEALLSRGTRLGAAARAHTPAGASTHAEPSRSGRPPASAHPHSAGPWAGSASARTCAEFSAGAASVVSANAAAHAPQRLLAAAGAARPVRIVHIADARSGRRTSGRLVISGRMADVCAELSRLAAQEALAH